MSIKDALIKGNRYEDVLAILIEITNIENIDSFPLHIPMVDNENNTLWYIPAEDVIKQAFLLYDSITNNVEIIDHNDFVYLTAFVNSNTNILLHNYAVAISHKLKPEVDIETIRIWEILNNLLENLQITEYDWEIPAGWKKEI